MQEAYHHRVARAHHAALSPDKGVSHPVLDGGTPFRGGTLCPPPTWKGGTLPVSGWGHNEDIMTDPPTMVDKVKTLPSVNLRIIISSKMVTKCLGPVQVLSEGGWGQGG